MDSFQENMFEYQLNQNKDSMEIKKFPKRHILTYPLRKNIYQMSELEYEYRLREFKQHLVGKGFQRADFNRIGSTIQRANFVKQAFLSQELFMFVPKKISEVATISLPAGNYAVYYCHSFSDELNRLDQFYQMIKAQGLQVMGDYICEVIYEVPKLNDNQRNMFIRMQVLVI